MGQSSRRKILYWILIIGIILTACNFALSAGDCLRYAGIDLRNRIIGARAYINGLDPYMSSWDPSRGDQYLDPIQRYPGPSRNTVPPTHLLLYIPYALLPYKTARILWFITEWLLFFLAGYFLTRSFKGSKFQLPFLAAILLFFSSSYILRLHVERGQYYVVLLFFFSLLVLNRDRGKSYYSGIPLGILALLRPTFALAIMVLFLTKYRKAAVAATLTGLIVFLLTIPGDGIKVWRSYFSTCREWEQVWLDPTYLPRMLGPRISVPMVAEGMEFNRYLDDKSSIETFSGAVARLRKTLLGRNISWASGIDPIKYNRVALIILALSILFLTGFGRRRHFTFRQALFTASVLTLDVDFFLPSRWCYVDILFLIPLALIFPFLFSRRCPACIPILLFLGLTISQLSLLDGNTGTAFREALFMIGINLTLFLILSGSPITKDSKKKKGNTTVNTVIREKAESGEVKGESVAD